MSDSSSANETLTLRPDVVVTTLENEAVLLDLESKFFYSVNPSGWAVTRLFETGATRDQVRERCTAWGIDDTAHEEVGAFVDRLQQEGLIVANGAAAPPAEVQLTAEWASPTVQKHKEPLQRIMISAFDPTLPLAE